MKVGLTLGKFAPLHRGHQMLIEAALAECDKVLVLIYDAPETTRIPLPVRAGWIRKLYPGVEVLEAWDGPTEVGYTPEITGRHDAYLRRRLAGYQVTHFYSSEPYGDHVSRALGAVNRQVDPDRVAVGISGTLIREAPYERRAFVDPVVYRDLVTNVVLMGAPSTGKTTLAQRLAEEYGTVWMPEYGREYWSAHQVDRRLSPEQLVEIAEGHLVREEEHLLEAREYLFTDTNAITTWMFAQYYHGFALPRLTELAAAAAARYDVVFVCADDIPYDDTWDRSGEVQRQTFQKQILADLAVRKIPYVMLHGSLDQRVAQVRAVLGRFAKYQNPGELCRGM